MQYTDELIDGFLDEMNVEIPQYTREIFKTCVKADVPVYISMARYSGRTQLLQLFNEWREWRERVE